MKNDKETNPSVLVDQWLRQAGWDPADQSQVQTAAAIPRTHVSLQEASSAGAYPVRPSEVVYADDHDDQPGGCVLLARNGRPLAMVEAKRGGVDPHTAKQQTLPMARRIGAPFIFLSDGERIYFWDYLNDDARSVSTFYSRRDLERLVCLRTESKPVATVPIPDEYVRRGERRSLRPYQKECMKALDRALEPGKRRFLIELPPGAGKTDLIALYLKRLVQAGRAERVLFVVDREPLATQAIDTIRDLLDPIGSYRLKAGMERQERPITVCALQTLISRYREFTSAYFDVVIADECHRAIYGTWPAALTHFDAVHIGLTATPAADLARNTFRFYRCDDGAPDFAFPVAGALQAEFLAPYKFASGITDLIAGGTEIDGRDYDPAAFERHWTNERANRKMMAEFDRLAWENYRELAPGQKIGPGKAIVFAITKHHAGRLAQYLNELHPEPNGRYAVAITSDVPDADKLIGDFKHETYPMVAVSVDMLATGFDCREILHLAFCRRVFSPILYQQMRGRGARVAPHIQKKKFVIYDFFGNRECFNDRETDIFASQSGSAHCAGTRERPLRPPGELIDLCLADEWLGAGSDVELGSAGEWVDKKVYLTNWEQTLRSAVNRDPRLRKLKEGQPLSPEEAEALEKQLNRPRSYFNEDNLRRAYRRPSGTLVDFIRAALGAFNLKSREDELTENFQAWLVARNLTVAQARYLALLKNRGVKRGKVQLADLEVPPLSVLNAAGLGVELFGGQGLKEIIADLNRAVFEPTPLNVK